MVRALELLSSPVVEPKKLVIVGACYASPDRCRSALRRSRAEDGCPANLERVASFDGRMENAGLKKVVLPSLA
jgi:hypothetical protein